MEIIKKTRGIPSTFNEVEELVSEYKGYRVKTFESYEKRSQTIFVFVWLMICFLFAEITFIGALVLFAMLPLYFLVPGVTEAKKVERFFFFFWSTSFKIKVSLRRDEIILQLLLLRNVVKKMQYYSKWDSVASDAKKIMGV